MIQAFIFDLDGVVVDTAKYHYLAWKELAGELGFDFPEAEGERLKGVSRMDSLEIVLESGRITGLTAEEKKRLADRKIRVISLISTAWMRGRSFRVSLNS